MQRAFMIALIAALGTGGIFAIVTTLEGIISRSVGAVFTSLWEHVFAGGLAIMLVAVLAMRGNINWLTLKGVLPQVVLTALLILLAVTGIAYAIPHLGVAVGNFAMVIGQVVIAILIDAAGVGGLERIPLSLPRVFGVILMASGLYFVIPRN